MSHLDIPGRWRLVNDRVAAWVRTMYPVALGFLVAWAVAQVAERFGVNVDPGFAFEALSLASAAAVYSAGRWLEGRRGGSWPAIAARFAGRWLLSLGLHTGQPVYVPRG